MPRSQIHPTIDLDGAGKQQGHLLVPHSYNLAGWANVMIPVTVISNGEGPNVLLLAGNHGDEFPGPVAILKLCRELEVEHVSGRIIMIPALNLPAVVAAKRLSPVDGQNMNRCFPGDVEGTLTERIAHFVTTELFPRVETVIDLHTGGRGMNFVPCAHMHLVPDDAQRRAMAAATEAFNTEFAFLYADIAGNGLLPVEAERQGKIVVTTEMGGGETVLASVHRSTQSGLRNVLVHLGVIRGETETRADLGLPPTRWVQALSRGDYHLAPESGIWESVVDLGSDVANGTTVGFIHFLERPGRAPVAIDATADGVLIGNRAPSLVSQGDCVAVIAQDVDPAILN